MPPMNTASETPEVGTPFREVMREQGRKISWLARQTGKAERTVWGYAYGNARAPQEWLDKVSELLGVKVR